MNRTGSQAVSVSHTERTMRLVSRALHPYIVIGVAVPVLTYKAVPAQPNWILWALVALLPAYLFPIGYMRIRGLVIARRTGIKPGLRSFFRERPQEMLIMALLFGVPSILILYALESPPQLLQAMAAVTISSVIIALLNHYYRASFHLGSFAGLAVVLGLEFHHAVATGVLVLLGLAIGWSRLHLHEHSPLQVLSGILIGIAAGVAAVIIFS